MWNFKLGLVSRPHGYFYASKSTSASQEETTAEKKRRKKLNSYLLIALVMKSYCDERVCSRVPLGITTDALPPDNLYFIEISDLVGLKYIPGSTYGVTLNSKDQEEFIAFTIYAKGDEKENPENPRKPRVMQPGVIRPADDEDNAKSGEPCNNTVIHNNVRPKSSVKVTWVAPGAGNGCVTISALVAISTDMYYEDKGPLKKRICEDETTMDDMLPNQNTNCSLCQDAKYKLTFEGLWSPNTHRFLFPSSNMSSVPSFSDIVGASHDKNYDIFQLGEIASKGIQSLAEQGNTTELEVELQAQIGQSVRTIIKASHPPTTNGTATALFRVSPQQHRASIVAAILPSPDWFLGASHVELCNAKTNTWAEKVTLNLYPMDAGTDKGTDFNSANDVMMPAQAIERTKFIDTQTWTRMEYVKPFAKIRFNLVRTYELTPACLEKPEDDGDGTRVWGGDGGDGTGGGYEEVHQTPSATTTSEAPVDQVDPDSSDECPMTVWSDWGSCESQCVGGKRSGYHMRTRHHIVDGEPYNDSKDKLPSEECFNNNDTEEHEPCEEDCEEPGTADPASLQQPATGQSWRFWSRK